MKGACFNTSIELDTPFNLAMKVHRQNWPLPTFWNWALGARTCEINGHRFVFWRLCHGLRNGETRVDGERGGRCVEPRKRTVDEGVEEEGIRITNVFRPERKGIVITMVVKEVCFFGKSRGRVRTQKKKKSKKARVLRLLFQGTIGPSVHHQDNNIGQCASSLSVEKKKVHGTWQS